MWMVCRVASELCICRAAFCGHEKNVRDVVAMLLVEVTALLGEFQGLSGGDVLEIDDGVGHAALGSDDQAFEADGFLAIRIADLRIFGDGEIQLVRDWAGPLDGAGDGATVGDGDDFVAALSGGKGCNHKGEKQQKTTSNQTAHSKNP